MFYILATMVISQRHMYLSKTHWITHLKWVTFFLGDYYTSENWLKIKREMKNLKVWNEKRIIKAKIKEIRIISKYHAYLHANKFLKMNMLLKY